MTEFNPKLKLAEPDNVCHRPHRRLSPPLLGGSQEHQACHCPGTIILYLENCLQPFRGTKISPSPLLLIDYDLSSQASSLLSTSAPKSDIDSAAKFIGAGEKVLYHQ